MTESTGDRLRRNTRSAMLTWVWGQGLQFVRMMVLYAFLAAEGYGLWTFAFSIMTYFVIYNFGVANAFVKYSAEYSARRDYDRLSHLLSTGTAISAATAAATLSVLLLATGPIMRFFGLEDSGDARFTLIGVGITTAFTMAFSVYESVLVGIHRLDLKNYCRVFAMTFEFVAVVVLLNMGYGLRAVVVTYGLSILATTILSAWFVYRNLPGIRIAPWHARRDCLPDVVSLGGRMILLGIVAMLVSTADMMVFMKYHGAAFVGAYGVARTFAQRAQGAAQQGFGALAPASADLIARERYEELALVYAAAQRFTAIGSALIFAFLAVNSDVVMLFVMDEKYEAFSAVALTSLSFGYFVHSLTGPGSSMLRGAGRVARELIYQILTVVFFAGAYFGAAAWWGVEDEGLLVSTWPLGLSAASLLFVVMANQYFRVHAFAPFGQTLLPLLAAPLIAWGVRLGWLALPLEAPHSRWAALAAIAAMGGCYAIGCAIATWKLPGLTASDREQLIRFVPGARHMLDWIASTPT